jgi:hypothetical protein
LVAGVDACVEEIVTDNTLQEQLTMTECMVGLPAIVKWKSEHPLYHSDTWRVAKWGCRIGNKPSPPPEGRA